MTTTPTSGSTFFGLDISKFSTKLLSFRRKISKRVLLLEFSPTSLLLAEATLTQAGVQLSHVSSVSIPPEALDRGVPSEPLKMARFIQDICTEKKIPAHRVAVVLPHELAFQRLIELPATLTREEAREYVLNPVNGLQIPFPLTQTDFDLVPVSPPKVEEQVGEKRLYMLTAIPEVLVDPIVEMLQVADLELQLLELGSHSQLRNYAASLITLAPQQVDMVLDLRPDCSHLMLVSCSGLLGSERLASIRPLPEFDFELEQQEIALASGFAAEDLIFKDENYLPLSELDLRVLVADLRASLERFHFMFPEAQIRRLILTGVNSAHPLLVDLLGGRLGLPVVLSSSSAVTGLVGFSMDNLLLKSGLDHLVGLALGLLSNEQLLTCSLDGHGLPNQDFDSTNDAVAISDFLSSSDAQSGVELVEVVTSPAAPLDEDLNDKTEISSLNMNAEGPTFLSSDNALEADLLAENVDQIYDSIDSQPLIIEAEELPTSLIELPSLDEAPYEIEVEETHHLSSLDQEEPTSSLGETDSSQDSETVDDADASDGQWPSIKIRPAAEVDQNSSRTFNDVSLKEFSANKSVRSNEISSSTDVSLPEQEWPSITSTELGDLNSEKDFEDDIAGWPSISSNYSEKVDDPLDLVTSEDCDSEDLDCDQIQDLPSSDQNVESNKLTTHSVDMTSSLEETVDEREDVLFIPNLSLSDEKVQSKQQTNAELTVSDDLDLTEECQDLGELRFSDDN